MDKTLRRKLLVKNPLLEYQFPARWVTKGLQFPLLARYQPPVVVMFKSPEVATRGLAAAINGIVASGDPIQEIVEKIRSFPDVYASQVFLLERPEIPWEYSGFRGMDLIVFPDEVRAKILKPSGVQVTCDLPAIPILPLTLHGLNAHKWEGDSMRAGAVGGTDRQIDYEGGTISAEQYSKITRKPRPLAWDEMTPLQQRQHADEQSECRV